MGRDDVLNSENGEKGPDFIQRQAKLSEVSIGKRGSIEGREWRRRYEKATSKEKLEIEDEIITDFLTHRRRRRGFIARNPAAKAAAASLNRLEAVLYKDKEGIRGRPRYARKAVVLSLSPDFVKHLDDYAQKVGQKSRQAAIEWIVRDFLRSNGYPVA